jgi:hypothetical protein
MPKLKPCTDASGGDTKNFLLFVGENYYARGGIHDLIESYTALEDAIAIGKHQISLYGMNSPEWWHVYDIRKGEIVAGSSNQGYGVEGSKELAIRAWNKRV